MNHLPLWETLGRWSRWRNEECKVRLYSALCCGITRLVLMADLFEEGAQMRLQAQSTNWGWKTFQGNKALGHDGSVTYISPLHALSTMAFPHSLADPIRTLLIASWNSHFALNVSSVFTRPGVAIVMPIPLPASILRVSKKFTIAPLLACIYRSNHHN